MSGGLLCGGGERQGPRPPFEEVRGFARDLAEKLSSRHPDQLTAAPRKEARKSRLYLDVQRNGYAQTAVAPYAVRARAGAPAWGELDDPALGARRWTLTMLEDLLYCSHVPADRR